MSKSDCVWFQVQSLAWCLVFGFVGVWCLGFRFNPTWMGDLVVPATRVSKAGRGLLLGCVGEELSFKLGFKLFYAC